MTLMAEGVLADESVFTSGAYRATAPDVAFPREKPHSRRLTVQSRSENALILIFRFRRVAFTEFVLMVGHDISAGLQFKRAEVGA
jgi:hypothetical protein